jgi:hypothetical protein
VYIQTTGKSSIYAGTALVSAAAIATTAVHYATYNGASSSLRINGVEVAAGDAGAAVMSIPHIGQSATGSVPFIGSIADVIIVAGANYAARAAAADALMRAYYGI